MKLTQVGCVAGVLAGLASIAQGQLQNASFETASIFGPTQPAAWDRFNGAVRRTVGDGLTPTLTSAHTGVAVVEETPQPIGPSDFIGYSSNAPIDPFDPTVKNNVSYTFSPPNGPDIRASAWFMIPASDPVVGHRAGLKLEFRRTVNDSVYEGFDYYLVDPADPSTFPGLVGVTTPNGAGVHTNGQWLQMNITFHQSQFATPLYDLPPVNPNAKVSLLAIRFGSLYADGGRGTIFFDDMSLAQVTPCQADVNNSGTVSVQDIFDFLALYFSSDPRADINHSGSVSVQDIFDFLALYFTGCP